MIGAYVVLLTVLNFGPTQRALTRAAADALSEKLGTDVSIGEVEVGLFNRVLLHDVCLKDLQKRNLLTARSMSAKIELRSLLPGRPISLRSVSLLDADIRLVKPTPDGDTNFQFIIDAFSSKKSKEPSKLDLRVNSLILRRVCVSYDELFSTAKPGKLDTGHIMASGINANISLKHISKNDLALRVRSLSFKERSGLALTGLTLKLHATRTRADIADFDLRLPHSHISQHALTATYDARNGMKDIGKTLSLRGNIDDATIDTRDLQALLPLKEIPALALHIAGAYDVTPDWIKLEKVSITDKAHHLSLSAGMTIHRSGGKMKSLSANVDKLNFGEGLAPQIVSTFTADSSVVNMLSRMGETEASANIHYTPNERAWGNAKIKTQAGTIDANTTWQAADRLISTRFSVNEARPAYLVANQNLPTLVSAKGNVALTLTGKKPTGGSGALEISKLQWRGSELSGINLSGNYKPGKITALLKSTDPMATLQADSEIRLQGKNILGLKIKTDISHIEPATLFPNKLYGQASFSGNLAADITQSTAKGALPCGTVTVRNFSMNNSPRGNYYLDKLDLSVTKQDGGQQLMLTSDFADASISGYLSTETIIAAASQMARRSLPGLWRGKEVGKQATAQSNSTWNIKASVKRTDFFEKMLDVDISLESPLIVGGVIDGGSGRTSLTASTDGLSISGQQFGVTSIYLNGKNTQYQCLLKTQRKIKEKNFDLVADLHTRDSSLVSKIVWKSHTLPSYEGRFESTTRFDVARHNANSKSTALAMKIHPTQFVLADSVWNISSGTLALEGRELTIENLSICHANQSLTASGHIAPNKNDSIVATLKDIDVEYILSMVDFHAVEFGGRATGTALFTQKGGYPEVNAVLRIPDFTFNKGIMGEADIIGSWSKDDNRIRLDANMKLPRVGGEYAGTKVIGYVDLAQKGLSLNMEAKHTNLQFLRRYVDGIFDHFDGDATGKVKLYGPFKQLEFEGRVDAKARARIVSTGVYYNVYDGYVEFAPGLFAFHDFKVTDDHNGTGNVSGNMRHTHLKKLNYDFSLTANHLLCYDQPQTPDMPFFSTTTGTGSMRLSGQPGLFTADISLQPEAPTTLTYVMGSDSPLSTNDAMVRFHSVSDEQNEGTIGNGSLNVEETVADVSQSESTTDVWLNFLINATPAAQVKIVTDPRAGDAITAYGDGTIRATWHNKGSFEMYGTYTLSRGTYKLSLQDVIRKDLTLEPGSTLTFSGNPLEADLGLKAKYTVNGASLSDLNYSAGFSQKTVKVDCILNIGGKAKNPQVDFDLDLQGISEDEKQMVRQLIATDEDMNRQVIYLLGIGRFYTANTESSSSTVSTQQQSSAAMRSLLSTTLTSQLNSAISSVLGSDSHWSFGTNVATGTYGWNDMEVDGLLQGRLLNDRLLINGNFGYRDRPTYTSNFVGDFDIRYLLTPRGSVSLRAYSETNDRYFTKSSLTTQGIGLTLKRDFNTFGDLFRWRKKKAGSEEVTEKK